MGGTTTERFQTVLARPLKDLLLSRSTTVRGATNVTNTVTFQTSQTGSLPAGSGTITVGAPGLTSPKGSLAKPTHSGTLTAPSSTFLYNGPILPLAKRGAENERMPNVQPRKESLCYLDDSGRSGTRDRRTGRSLLKSTELQGLREPGGCVRRQVQRCLPDGSHGVLINSRGPSGPRASRGLPGPAGATHNCSATPYPGIDLAACSLISAKLIRANLTGADLAGADLSDGEVNSSGANLTDANLIGANLTDANLSGQGGDTGQTGATLTDANLTGADLTDADLFDADLSGANLTGANLTGASINNGGAADVESPDLSGADLTDANLTDADLSGADMQSAKLDGVTWSNTICPDGSNSNSDSGTCAHHL